MSCAVRATAEADRAGVVQIQDFRTRRRPGFLCRLSIAPVIVLAFTAASLVLGEEAAQGRVSQEIESTVGHTVAVAIQATILRRSCCSARSSRGSTPNTADLR